MMRQFGREVWFKDGRVGLGREHCGGFGDGVMLVGDRLFACTGLCK